jgi:hypothetical protein
MVLYIYHRLDCLSNVYRSLGLIEKAKLALVVVHASADTAERDFLRYIKYDVFENSPYFHNLYNLDKSQIRLVAAGPRTNSIIGLNVFAVILSEIGHIPPALGVERVNEVLTRVESRFKDKRFNFTLSICDSSARDEDNRAVKKFEEGCNEDEILKVHPAIWEVRKNLYAESGDKTFKVYLGDAIREPYVIENEKDIEKDNLDLDRIINVPLSAKYRFLNDIVRSIRDLAGINFSYENKFFKNIIHLINCSKIKNYAPEEIVVDFYNKSDSIFDKVSGMIFRIPRGTNLFIHADVGLRKDKCAISCCMFDKEIVVGNSTLPTFKFPFMFLLSRLPGQSTSLDHIYQFLKDLIKNGYYITFSADSFASAGLFQSCERDGIPYKSISADKTMDAHIMFKNVINTERAELVYHNTLLREASEALVVYNGKSGEHMKIDHPQVSKCTEFDYSGKIGEQPGTKDLLDACSSALYSCYQKYAEYKEGGVGGSIKKGIQAMDSITKDPREETAKVFQDMIESIW